MGLNSESLLALRGTAERLPEIIEWAGFAIMAWNLPALSFLVWTYANLLPRARNHHQWYLRTFPDYPRERKVVFPGVW